MRIIYFDLDTLRPDHLGCYDYHRPTSPNIDRIAAEGMRFDHAYCSSSPCLPSRTALVSGRFGIRNGVIGNFGAGAQFRLKCRNYVGPEFDNEMLPRVLRRNGLDTISFSTFADRHNAYTFNCGWAEVHTPNLKGGMESSEEVNASLLPWLKQNAQREDYFLHINYWDAHHPYSMDARWAERFDGIPLRLPWPDELTIQRHRALIPDGPIPSFSARFNLQTSGAGKRFPLMPEEIRTRADFEKLVTGYDAAIAYMDHQVGVVLDELDRQGMLDDAVIIVSSDHGEAFGEHGIYASHLCADECVHRIPLIVRWPGVAEAGRTCDELLYNLDLGLTLCDVLGIEVTPSEWDGASFAACLGGGVGPGRDHLIWDHGLQVVQRAVRTRTHLMLRTYDDYDRPGFEPLELYDILADPYQSHNVCDERSSVVVHCEGLLSQWLQEQRVKTNYGPDPIEEILRERGATGRRPNSHKTIND